MANVILPDSAVVRVPAIGKEYTIAFSDLSPETVLALALHGFKQKVGDAAAGTSDLPQVERIALCDAVADRIAKGELRSSGGGRRLTFEDRAERQVLARYFANYPDFKKADAAQKAAKRDDAWATLAKLAGTDESMVRETLAPQIAKVAANLRAAEEDVIVDLGGLKA